MKKIIILSLLLIFMLSFASCTMEDAQLESRKQEINEDYRERLEWINERSEQYAR
jgi:hypothetical protein